MLFPTQVDRYNNKFNWATWLLIIINIVVFVWELQIPENQIDGLFRDLLVVPANIVANPFSVETLFDMTRSTFMHGSFMHLFGNMLFLHLFGSNVERRIGSWLFLYLYGIAGIVAIMLHVIVFPHKTIPLLGASGAISGMMGMFLILFPASKIKGLFPLGVFIYPFIVPYWGIYAFPIIFVFLPMRWYAWFFLGLILFRDISGAMDSINSSQLGGTAHFGHLGGFVAGIFFGIMIWLAILTHPHKNHKQRNV